MLAFEEALGVPTGHVLRQVRFAPGIEVGTGLCRWEHEEYDEHGRLVAVYESWLRDGGGIAFVKYSSMAGSCAVTTVRHRSRS